jgi:hypothetical protein
LSCISYLVLHQWVVYLSSLFAAEIVFFLIRTLHIFSICRRNNCQFELYLSSPYAAEFLSIRTVPVPFFSICRGNHCRFEPYKSSLSAVETIVNSNRTYFSFCGGNHCKSNPSYLFRTAHFFFCRGIMSIVPYLSL